MLRAFANSMMNAWRDFTTPMSDLPKTVMQHPNLSYYVYFQPSFVIQREYTPSTSLRIYDYRIANAKNTMMFIRIDIGSSSM